MTGARVLSRCVVADHAKGPARHVLLTCGCDLNGSHRFLVDRGVMCPDVPRGVSVVEC